MEMAERLTLITKEWMSGQNLPLKVHQSVRSEMLNKLPGMRDAQYSTSSLCPPLFVLAPA